MRMSILQEMKLLDHRVLGTNLLELVLQTPPSYMVEPGQFVTIQVDEGNELLLRRPFSVADFDSEQGHLHVIYKVVGVGTERMRTWEVGQMVSVMGPLGQGFPLLLANQDKIKKPRLLIGGGVGLAPLYYLAKVLAAKQIPLVIAAGFRSADEAFYLEAFQQLGEVIVATEDGSLGEAGYVTQYLPAQDRWELYYACGPRPMLDVLTQQLSGKLGYLSLEERMACGIGVCQGCVHPSTKPFRVCTDGPVVAASEVESR